LMMAPVFLWNSNHEWASFNYQFMSRHQESHGADWNRWFQFWVQQWVFMSPVIYFLMIVAFFYGIKKIKDDRWRFIFALPAPALALFYYQPLMSAYKPHWSGPAYMILLFGAVQIFTNGIPGFLKPQSKFTASLAIFFLIPFQLIYIPLLTPIAPKIYASINKGRDTEKWNPAWDFTNEFYGWLELGDQVKKVRSELAAKNGKTPLLGAQRYELIAQFTWATKETIWQLSHDRDHYLYEQTDAEREQLIGQDFLIVNTNKYEQDPLEIAKFDSCEKQQWPFYRGDVLARVFNIYCCKNYQGLR